MALAICPPASAWSLFGNSVDPSQFCSQPEVVAVMKDLKFHNPFHGDPKAEAAYEEYRHKSGEDKIINSFAVIGGRTTDVANVYSCSAKAIGYQAMTFKLEAMSNGSFVVTDMTSTGW
jgi:hypothetical protein